MSKPTIRLEIEITPMLFLIHRDSDNQDNYLIAKFSNNKTTILKRNVSPNNLLSEFLEVVKQEAKLVPYPVDLTKIPSIIKENIQTRIRQEKEVESSRMEAHRTHFQVLFDELQTFELLLIK